MARKIFFISLIALIAAAGFTFLSKTENAEATSIPVDPAARQTILDATVRMTMYAKDSNDSLAQNERQYVLGDGLGTLVQDGSQQYIVSHDHWSRVTNKLQRVQFHNAAGDLLLELDRDWFYSLVQYRDGGTMILTAPEAIQNQLTAVPVAKGQALQENQTLLIAFWQPESSEQVSVEPVSVIMTETYQGQTAIRMNSLNGKVVVQGNSGGGVFADGQLVGNMWETLVIRQQENGQVSDEGTATTMSRAAQYGFETEDSSSSESELTEEPILSMKQQMS
jgi:hypothetical protein